MTDQDGNHQSRQKTCFVISPIGEPGTPERIQSDVVLDFLIKPVFEDLEYRPPVRADNDNTPGSISEQILRHLIQDEIVVADLSRHNPNVFYELAIRHAARKPIIHLIHKDDSIPFDVKDIRAIKYDHENIREFEQAKTQLKEQINAIEIDFESIPSPIKTAILNSELRAGPSDVERGIAEILTGISNLSSRMNVVIHSSPESSASEIPPKPQNTVVPFKAIRNLWVDFYEMPYEEFGQDVHIVMDTKIKEILSPYSVTDDEVFYIRHTLGENKSDLTYQEINPIDLYSFVKNSLGDYRKTIVHELSRRWSAAPP